MIERVLQPIREFVSSFVDDMAVCTETKWEDHIRHIPLFLLQIHKCGLTLTLKKSQFAQPYVKFCGRIVGSGTHRVDPARRESILLLKEPETKK